MWAAACGFTAVALGALGAHALRPLLEPAELEVYKTAALYHLVHSVLLVGLALWSRSNPDRFIVFAARSILGGVVLFSGSLYLLSLRHLMHLEALRYLGPVTPLGGLLFMTGYGFLFYAGWKHRNSAS